MSITQRATVTVNQQLVTITSETNVVTILDNQHEDIVVTADRVAVLASFTPAADSGTGTPVDGTLTVAGDAPVSTSVSANTITVSHDASGISAGAFTNPSQITVDSTGHVTAASTFSSTPLVTNNNLSEVSPSGARDNLGITNKGAYTGHIETAQNKDYILDPTVVTSRTITQFFCKTGSGSCTAALKKGATTISSLTASTSSGAGTIITNGVAANDELKLEISGNSSATDVIFTVEYSE